LAHSSRISPTHAATLIADGSTIALSASGGGLGEPDTILEAIEARFLETGHPRNLTLVHALGLGDRDRRGTNRFAHEGMVKRVIGGHWTWSPSMQALAAEERIEAYSLPSGVISLLIREIGAGRPGLITKTGLDTFVDPRRQGGKVNASAQDDLVELMAIDGEEYLRFKPFRIDVGIIRGTAADSAGNVTAREEPADLDMFSVALATHNCGGITIAQVRDHVACGAIAARDVCIPAFMVAHVVVVPDQFQTYRGGYDISLAGLQLRADLSPSQAVDRGLRRVVALRAAEELRPGTTVNFGFGMSAGVAGVIAERKDDNLYSITIEQGIHGGAIETGDLFGMAVNPTAIISSTEQFDIYHGGGLDIAFLGMAEFDSMGNVNVSHLSGKIVGPGGFIDIAQNAQKVVFCGTFDAKSAQIEVVKGGLAIHSHGLIRKLVREVAAVTFSGKQARLRNQEVIFVTERAVFRLVDEGIELVEYAEGVDVEADVIARMGFRPIVRNPRPMNPDCFQP